MPFQFCNLGWGVERTILPSNIIVYLAGLLVLNSLLCSLWSRLLCVVGNHRRTDRQTDRVIILPPADFLDLFTYPIPENIVTHVLLASPSPPLHIMPCQVMSYAARSSCPPVHDNATEFLGTTEIRWNVTFQDLLTVSILWSIQAFKDKTLSTPEEEKVQDKTGSFGDHLVAC